MTTAIATLLGAKSLFKPTNLTFPATESSGVNNRIKLFKPIKQNVTPNLVTLRASARSSPKPTKSAVGGDCCNGDWNSPMVAGTTVDDRLRRVVSEFKSLTEPVDRVKRLLDYAACLPRLDGSARVPENRVVGCTTQVWVEAEMEEESGRVRFRGDSDSEITKGFVSCLIRVLDGGEAAEVVAVRAEELEAVNVGVYGKEKSRVNTWYNVLVGMQERTKALVAEQMKRTVVPPPAPACHVSFR